jgi:hypothetical protein
LLVGGYAVILHGYIRSTADIWVDKSKRNYQNLKKALSILVLPLSQKKNFLGTNLTYGDWGESQIELK